MRERLEKRLAELESEYETGQEMLADLEAKRTDLQQTLLRISGAAQVLRELLETPPAGEDNGGRAHADAVPAELGS